MKKSIFILLVAISISSCAPTFYVNATIECSDPGHTVFYFRGKNVHTYTENNLQADFVYVSRDSVESPILKTRHFIGITQDSIFFAGRVFPRKKR